MQANVDYGSELIVALWTHGIHSKTYSYDTISYLWSFEYGSLSPIAQL